MASLRSESTNGKPHSAKTISFLLKLTTVIKQGGVFLSYTPRKGVNRVMTKSKAQEKLEQVIFAVGPTTEPFTYPNLTNNRYFTSSQQKYIKQHLIKMNFSQDWIFNQRSQSYIKEKNIYRWKNPQHIREIYLDIVSKVKTHKPKLGRAKTKDVEKKVQIELPVDNWNDTIVAATENDKFTDITILNNLDRKVEDNNVIITTSYYQSGGRLYTQVQNLTRAIRPHLFNDWHDYDINAALPSVVWQLCPQGTDMILEYIENKDRIRNDLAEELETDVKTVKHILNAVFLGVKTHNAVLEWDLHNHRVTGLVRMLGVNIKKLTRNKWFTEFTKQVRYAQKTISDRIKTASARINGQWHIVNLNGDKLILDRWHAGKAVVHFYYGIEREIIKQTGITTKDNNLVLFHDGFLVDKQLDSIPNNFQIDHLELDISFSHEILSPDRN